MNNGLIKGGMLLAAFLNKEKKGQQYPTYKPVTLREAAPKTPSHVLP